jgi:mono/diheme cytochrome c family protein
MRIKISVAFLTALCILIFGFTIEKTIVQQTDQPEGSQLYKKYCLACHQATGKGIRNMFPPLTGNEKITGPPAELIKIVLFGLEGPIIVNGREYNQPMPPQAYLTDSQIAEILTFIRKSWGNDASPITSANVKKIRKQGKK